MNLNYFDKEGYKDVPLLKMGDNKYGDLHFFIRKYSLKNCSTRLHRHEYMQINYVYQGKAKHLINNQELEINKGDIFVIPPYIPHAILKDDDSVAEIYEFEFEPKFINQNFEKIQNTESFMDFAYIEPFLVSESDVKPRLNLLGKIEMEVEDILNEVLREYIEKKSGYILLIKSLLLKLLVLVGREFTAYIDNTEARTIYDRHRGAIFEAEKYIDEHYMDELSVEYVAKKSMLSQSYFSYLFKSITSKTFVEYLNGLRISKALEFLKGSDKSILDICYQVGFNNINHFNRTFRQQMGMSPMAYRRNTY